MFVKQELLYYDGHQESAMRVPKLLRTTALAASLIAASVPPIGSS
jgi:hypothetical protein